MTNSRAWPVVERAVVRRERWPGGYNIQCFPLVRPGQEVLPDQPVLRRREGDQAEVVPSGIYGHVTAVTSRGGIIIECHAAILHGALGAGNQVAGILTLWHPNDKPHSIPHGAILVVPGPLDFAFLRRAISSGIVGVIASSIELRDLEGFLQTDLIQLLDSKHVEQAQAHLPPMTVLLTEGLGSFAMPPYVISLLQQYEGALGLLSGVTSLRQGISPELILSHPNTKESHWQPVEQDTSLTPGAQVRVTNGEYAGKVGIIDYLFTYQQAFSSGVRAYAARLVSEDGTFFIVPLLLLERVG